VLDEWAHSFDPEALWVALEPTLPARASSALITTARSTGDFVHDYWRRSQAGQTRHTPVFVSALERRGRSPAWLEHKRREEGKWRSLRNYPLTAEDAFASAGEPYFTPELLAAAQQEATLPPSARRGDRYLKAWDIGRTDASVCVVLRTPSAEEPQVWTVVDYRRLVSEDYPTIQGEIEAAHAQYPGPTVVEVNSVGMPLFQNLRLPKSALIEHTTTKASKQAMLTELELLLQQRTLKIHPKFQQLLAELGDYRLPDDSLTQDSVMALGFAVTHAHQAYASGGRINRRLFRELNDLPERRLRPGDRGDDATPSRRGVSPLPESGRRLGAGAPRCPRRARQLLDPQDTVDPALACPPPALRAPLHADLQLLAESGRALVRGADDEVDQARRTPLGPRSRRLDPNLDRQLERQPEALRLAQNRRRDPRQPRLLLPADQRLRSLAVGGQPTQAQTRF
jgi:hypothetical protein